MKKLILFLQLLIITSIEFLENLFPKQVSDFNFWLEGKAVLHITPQEKMQLGVILDNLEKQSKRYGNYNPDAGNYQRSGILNYNPDAGNYGGDDGILRIGGAQAANWAQDKQASTNLATYRVKIFYTPVSVTPLPVDIRFFASAYPIGGVFTGGTQVFTNTGGDTATIVGRGRTTNWESMFNINSHENMCVEFLRIRPKSESQLENPIVPLHNSQFNSASNNEISPDDYITPNQYQLLRADVPLGYNVGLKKGFDWTIDQDQTGTGIGMVMFISSVLDKDMALKNKQMIRQFGASSAFFTPTAPVGAIENLITQKALGNG